MGPSFATFTMSVVQPPLATSNTLLSLAGDGDLAGLQSLVQKQAAESRSTPHVILSTPSSLSLSHPLHAAAENGKQDVVRWILQQHTYPSPGNAHHVSPLQLACLKGHVGVVADLLEAGALVHMADHDGDTALHWAGQNGSCDIIQRLLDAGAQVDRVNKHGWTPLFRAAFKNQNRAAALLCNSGADFNAADSQGCTSLHHACAFTSLDVIRLCVQSADVEKLDDGGYKCWGSLQPASCA